MSNDEVKQIPDDDEFEQVDITFPDIESETKEDSENEAVEKADKYADDLQEEADKELEEEFDELEKALDDS